LLRAANIEHAFVLTLVYALSTGAILFGQDARAYALASLLVLTGALFAHLASDFAPRDGILAGIYAVAMAACCGIALQTNYLTLFPVGFILVWFLWQMWPVWWAGALAVPCIAAAIGMIGISTLLTQTGMRPHWAAGYAGLLVDVKAVLMMNLNLFWSRALSNRLLGYGVTGGLLVLMVSSYAQFLLICATPPPPLARSQAKILGAPVRVGVCPVGGDLTAELPLGEEPALDPLSRRCWSRCGRHHGVRYHTTLIEFCISKEMC
jgi:hypothetical protein